MAIRILVDEYVQELLEIYIGIGSTILGLIEKSLKKSTINTFLVPLGPFTGDRVLHEIMELLLLLRIAMLFL